MKKYFEYIDLFLINKKTRVTSLSTNLVGGFDITFRE